MGETLICLIHPVWWAYCLTNNQEIKSTDLFSAYEGCYKEGAKSRSYGVRIKSDLHLKQKDFQETAHFKELAATRYKIEAKNSEIKNRHGYDRASYAGLFGMQIQGATTLFVTNIKRIITLMEQE